MDPISLIVSALVAGAVAASQEVAGQVIKDGYNSLKTLLQSKFGGKGDGEDALAKVESKPESEARQAVLKEELESVSAGDDTQILTAAKELMAALQKAGGAGGTSYQATLTGSGAIAQGPGAVAAGAGGVAVGGNVSGSNIVTGSGNTINPSSSIFDQRGQNIHGNQTNVVGDMKS